MPPLPHRITITPDPPQAGKPIKICYDFDGLTQNDTTLVVDTDPDVGDQSIHPTRTNPCVTIQVPDTVYQMLIEDQDGNSEPVDRAVLPPAP